MSVASTTTDSGYHLRIALASRPAALAARLDPFEEMLDEVVEYGGVELVDDLLALPLRDDQPGVAELTEVARDRRPRRREMLGDVTGRLRPVLQQAEDVPAGRVGECLERVVHL